MSQEIRIGQKTFVLDDPRGTLDRVAPDDQHGEHEDSAPLDISMRRAEMLPPEPLPDNVDPLGSIRGRALLLERFYQGHAGGWGLLFAWTVMGTPVIYTFYMVCFWITDAMSRVDSLADGLVLMLAFVIGICGPGFGLWVLLHGTYASITRESR